MLSRKRISAPGPLGKLEAVEELVLRGRRVAADQVAHVQLGHLVVGQVEGLEAVRREVRASERSRLAAVGDLDADEDVRRARRRR